MMSKTLAMPVDRRRLLMGLAAASTAAAVTVAPTTTRGAGPLENARLIALSAALPAIADAYHAAADAYRHMAKTLEAATPRAPDEFTEVGTADPINDRRQPGEAEVTVFGGYLYRDGEKHPRRIVVTSWHVSRDLSYAKRVMRRAKKVGAVSDFLVAEEEVIRLKTLLAKTEAYEREFNAARAFAKGEYDRLYPVMASALNAFAAHVTATMDEEDVTMEGLLIKAQALAAWGGIGSDDKFLAGILGKDWHGKIAASILRHAARNA